MSNKIQITITGKNLASGVIKAVTKDLRYAAEESVKASTSAEKFGKALKGIAAAGAVVAIGAITAAVKILSKAVKEAADLQTVKETYKVLLDSASAANKLVKEMRDLAAYTPLTFAGMKGLAASLLAAGTASDEITDTIRMLGDAAMGSQVNLDSLGAAYTKVQTKGRASLRELNMFAYAGVPIISALAETLGTSNDQIHKMVSAGDIGFTELKRALQALTGEGGKFNGMMELQSQTLNGLINTLQDLVTQVLAKLGEGLVPVISIIVKQLNTALTDLYDGEKLNAWSKAIAIGLATAYVWVTNIFEYIRLGLQDITTWIEELFSSNMAANLFDTVFTNFIIDLENGVLNMAKPLVGIANKVLDWLGVDARDFAYFNYVKFQGPDIKWANASAFQDNVITPKINEMIALIEAAYSSNASAGSGTTPVFEYLKQSSSVDYGLPRTWAEILDLKTSELADAWVDSFIEGVNAAPSITGLNLLNGAPLASLALNLGSSVKLFKQEAIKSKSSSVSDYRDSNRGLGSWDFFTSYAGMRLSEVWDKMKAWWEGVSERSTQPFRYSEMSLGDFFRDLGGNIGIGLIDAFEHLGDFITQLGNAVMSLESVKAILDPVSVILQGAMDALQPLVDSILQPLLGGLRIIGGMLGSILAPVLEALIPIIQKVGELFVWLYNNILVPIGNALITVFNVLANAVTGVANLVIDIINLFGGKLSKLEYRSLDQGYLGKIDYNALVAAGSSYTGGSSSSTGSSTSAHSYNISIYQTVQGNVIGDGGMAELGKFCADAIGAYLGSGGSVAFLEA